MWHGQIVHPRWTACEKFMEMAGIDYEWVEKLHKESSSHVFLNISVI